MDKLLVLVNGLPGSGKSTVGRSLAHTLGSPFLSKDSIKEALASCMTDADGIPTLGGIAMDTVWALAQAVSGTVVIDSWWFRPRDLSFAAAGIQKAEADRAVEIWCDVPADVAKARYLRRRRSALYHDDQHLLHDWDTWATHARPLGLTPRITIDTTGPVDHARLAQQIELVAAPLTAGSRA